MNRDRSLRRAWLPLGAVLVFAIAASGSYSGIAGAADTYAVPPNTKLTDAQFASFQAGNLYVNVHTVAHTDGEIRGQLSPPQWILVKQMEGA